MSAFLLEGLLQSVLSTAVLIPAIILLQKCLKDKIRPRCFVWLYGVLALRLLIPASIGHWSAAAGGDAADVTENIGESAARAAEQGEGILPFRIESEGSVLNYVFMLWIAGMVIFLICFLANHYFFMRQMILRGKTAGNLWDMCRENGMPVKESFKQIRILICDYTASPMVMGYRKTYLCLPNTDWSDAELNMILRHELVHIRNHDLSWKLLFMAANIVQWFNPLAYLLRSNAEEYIELSCDDEVIKNMNKIQRREYAEFLLYLLQEAKQRRTLLALCTVERGKRLKNRFHFLLEKAEERIGKGWGVCAVCAALLLLVQIPAQCDILTTYYNNSYITIWYEEEGFQKSEKIMLSSLYYGICKSERIVPEKVERISGLEKISLEPGETLVLCASENAEAFDLNSGNVVEINVRIDWEAPLKIGLTNGSSHETTDTSPATAVIQKGNNGSLIYICNQTSGRVEFF